MKELQRNRDFLLALERGEKAPSEILLLLAALPCPWDQSLSQNTGGWWSELPALLGSPCTPALLPLPTPLQHLWQSPAEPITNPLSPPQPCQGCFAGSWQPCHCRWQENLGCPRRVLWWVGSSCVLSACGGCAEAKPQFPPLPPACPWAATGGERGAEPCALPLGPDRASPVLFVFQID